MAADLQATLDRIWSNLQVVIEDAGRGTASQYGFETFFHGNNNIPYVQKVYRSIAKGYPVKQETRGRAVNPLLNLGFPTIVCIQPGDPETAIPHATCETEPWMLAARASDNFIALCPSFWELDSEATIDKCPRLRRNTLFPDSDALTSNQEALLVHELSHMYGVVPLKSFYEGVHETYAVREAANLDERSALRNAPNYAYYYSSIRAGCTRWPNRALPQGRGRGTLEMPDNTTKPEILDQTVSVPASIADLCNVQVYAPNASVCCNTTSGSWVPSAGGVGSEVGNGSVTAAAC
ncbi:hypothetical protein ACLMJK_003277 [Lecanora helva]